MQSQTGPEVWHTTSDYYNLQRVLTVNEHKTQSYFICRYTTKIIATYTIAIAS